MTLEDVVASLQRLLDEEPGVEYVGFSYLQAPFNVGAYGLSYDLLQDHCKALYEGGPQFTYQDRLFTFSHPGVQVEHPVAVFIKCTLKDLM